MSIPTSESNVRLTQAEYDLMDRLIDYALAGEDCMCENNSRDCVLCLGKELKKLRQKPRRHKTIVFVSRGCVFDVRDENCKVISYNIVDEDFWENGRCAVCGEGACNACKVCGYKERDSYENAVAAIIRFEKIQEGAK